MLQTIILRFRDAADVLAWVILGALILGSYIDYRQAVTIPEVRYFLQFGVFGFLACRLIGLRSAKAKDEARRSVGPSPQISAWALTLAIGVGAAAFLMRDYRQPSDAMLPTVALLAAILAGFILARFARNHSAEIGEARFGVDGKPLGPWTPPKE